MHRKLTLKEIQREELIMLNQIVEFLDKNKIDYYLYAGTFLGAVRHKGFIPWDDDIDIILTRPNYDKFIKALRENNNKINVLEAVGYELGNDYGWPFIKILNKNISVKNERNIDKNLWIDVFVFDGIPKKSWFYFKKIKFLRYMLVFKKLHINNGKISEKSLLKKIRDVFFTFISNFLSLEKIISIYVSFCKKYNYNSSDYIYDNLWGSNDRHKISKDLLEISLYKFEGYEFKSFKNYDKILTIIYGDYMKLPPKDKRITHEFDAWYVNKK